MLLSIGMIVKNEEKILRDCLNGIKPILEQVASELVIFDTGSTDSTMEIAKEFTDKIYQIEWRNDFAWARNHTIEKSAGKWYMGMDADEIFEDVTDIVSFFNSGEYENYVCATFLTKQANSEITPHLWAVFPALRLARLTKSLRWEGEIHEYLTSDEMSAPGGAPRKTLTSYALHYGYCHETLESRKFKFERNIKPLLKTLDKDPSNIRTLCHIATEYCMIKQYGDALKYVKMGLAQCDKKSKISYYHALVHQQIIYNYFLENYAQVIEYSKDYFDTASVLYSNAANIKALMAQSLIALERPKEAMDAYRSALNYLEMAESGLFRDDIKSCTTVFTLTKEMLYTGILNCQLLDPSLKETDKMLLSIGMIVKNEEKYLRDCLSSILPILQHVPSELIIFDTGSTDSTIEIAKEFTDSVYEIKWQNDFAWARNHTLDKATGEWFMYIDADEKFLDTSDIVKFFVSGEYKNYNCASYRWRNILTDCKFLYTRPVRLYKMEENIRFVGKLHEYVTTGSDPVKNLESLAEHYGYYNLHITKEKHERNIKPLLEMHVEDPEDIRTISHIINEYLVREDTCDEAKKYIDIGFDVVGDSGDNPYYHVLYHNLIKYYKKKGASEEIVSVARKYLERFTNSNCAVVQTRYTESFALIELGRFEEAAKAAEQSLKCFDRYKHEKTEDVLSLYIPMDVDIFENRLVHIRLILMGYIGAGEFDKSLKWLVEYEKTKANTPECDIFEHLAFAFVKNKQWSGFTRMYQFVLQCGVDSSYYNDAINAIEKIANTSVENREIIALVLYPHIYKAVIDLSESGHGLTIKGARILSNTASLVLMWTMASVNASNKQKLDTHEAAIRMGHKYLSMLYNPSIYRAGSVESLSETDAYTFYAGEAFARKDEGDILGFVRGLRKAVQLDPKKSNIVFLCTDEVKAGL